MFRNDPRSVNEIYGSASGGTTYIRSVPNPDAQRELALVALADRSHKARLRDQLPRKRGRERFLSSLWHNPPFDPRYVTEVEFEHAVEKELIARGAPSDCYVISNNPDYDARTMPLGEALSAVTDGYGVDGTILLCIPGRLAFYRGEDGEQQWIVERTT